ncbi:MAG: AAA family ATPase [Ignavibacteria bacterium GWA2_55_11]|nr:MAG: AAA family ATPase [Ignavibacteria bacterium GWA2_55_11]
MTDLFGPSSPSAVPLSAPLAERLRPTTLDAFVGQSHLLASGMSLRTLIEHGEVSSMIFWGPPGVGKTTLARLIARHVKADFQQLNAVASGVKEVRDVISRAEKNRRGRTLATLLFIDEIHRFNKSQQDALLHAVEDGTLTLIGATTENPSFEVISPLLSRCQVYVLQSLGAAELGEILDRAMKEDIMLKELRLSIEDRTLLMLLSGGDARKLLNGLEIAVRIAGAVRGKPATITKHHIEQAYQRSASLYDKEGEQHYDIISAFIKSMRGSDPDAALYWMARMIDAGEDPKFIVRRMVVLASEDIGNADPQALSLAVSCFNAVDVIGMPEARIIMAQTAVYLASAPKSNASYLAVEHALEDARTFPNLPVPLHIRNAPTKLLKDLGYGSGYKYSHDFKGHFEEQQYLPDKLKDKVYYQPTEQGEEKSIKERLKAWWKRRRG